MLAAPAGDYEDRWRLEDWYAVVSGFETRAEQIGAPAVHHAYTPFFWELQQRDDWLAFFPNSRNVPHNEGLLDDADSHWEHYRSFRNAIAELRAELGATTWHVEKLLWRLGKGADTVLTTTSEDLVTNDTSAAETFDLYAVLQGRCLPRSRPDVSPTPSSRASSQAWQPSPSPSSAASRRQARHSSHSG